MKNINTSFIIFLFIIFQSVASMQNNNQNNLFKDFLDQINKTENSLDKMNLVNSFLNNLKS